MRCRACRTGLGLDPPARRLLLPIFDAGRNQARAQFGPGRAPDIAVAQCRKSHSERFREVADALAGRATLGDRGLHSSSRPTPRRIVSAPADLNYRNGVASSLGAGRAALAVASGRLWREPWQPLR
ncbi:MAG: hypothetical protein R3E55_02190 [Burkholderiaceae bacterium]